MGKGLVSGLDLDVADFIVKGKKVAATRSRKGLQEIKKLAQNMRNVVTEVKNERK